jgi:hypothetical protein
MIGKPFMCRERCWSEAKHSAKPGQVKQVFFVYSGPQFV